MIHDTSIIIFMYRTTGFIYNDRIDKTNAVVHVCALVSTDSSMLNKGICRQVSICRRNIRVMQTDM